MKNYARPKINYFFEGLAKDIRYLYVIIPPSPGSQNGTRGRKGADDPFPGGL